MRTFATAAQLLGAGFVKIPDSRVFTHSELPGLWFHSFNAGEDITSASGWAIMNTAQKAVVFSTKASILSLTEMRVRAHFSSIDEPAKKELSYKCTVHNVDKMYSNDDAGWWGAMTGYVGYVESGEHSLLEADSVVFGLLAGSCSAEGYLLPAGHNSLLHTTSGAKVFQKRFQ